jgi:hypothetical protein
MIDLGTFFIHDRLFMTFDVWPPLLPIFSRVTFSISIADHQSREHFPTKCAGSDCRIPIRVQELWIFISNELHSRTLDPFFLWPLLPLLGKVWVILLGQNHTPQQ